MKSVRMILNPEAASAYNSLLSKAPESKQEEIILNAFLQKVELLKENIHYGQPIAKKLIPAEYKTKYEITRQINTYFEHISSEHFMILESSYHGHKINEYILYPAFRRCLEENNIFPAIVFGHLINNLQLLSQLKLPEIEVRSFQ